MRLQLALSENPFPPLPSVVTALNSAVAQANRYPEFVPTRLAKIIATHLGLATETVVVGSGATGVAMQVMQALLADGDEIACATPTFDGYPILAAMRSTPVRAVSLDALGNQNLEALAAAVDERVRLVIVCRPHNPTGTLISAADLEWFLGVVGARTYVLLDEAYVEFVEPRLRLDARRLVVEHPNVIVLRTFSKAYGLAGLRVGYAIATPEEAERIRRWQVPFGVNATAVAAVTASYAAERELRIRVTRITRDREQLRDALRARGLRIPASHANFLYLPAPAAELLRWHGIAAKGYPDGAARVAVGDPEASAAVLAALS
ncbi:aminotransferase class I/II-fold pyridoxal phosphate-dependent enzyme [Skermania sp. ID1734]|nr:aminotransferase class I/II-fold pyridoxal phosphate-dependent enzyme [Skermania sp. ID1734]